MSSGAKLGVAPKTGVAESAVLEQSEWIVSKESIPQLESSTSALTNIISNSNNPHAQVISYCFSKSLGANSDIIACFKLYGSPETAKSYLSENEQEAERNTKALMKFSAGICLGVPENDDQLIAEMKFGLGAEINVHHKGTLYNPSALKTKWQVENPGLKPHMDKAVLLEIRLESKKGNAKELNAATESWLKSLDTNFMILSYYIVYKPWWQKSLGLDAISVNILYISPATFAPFAPRSKLAEIRGKCKNIEMIVTTRHWNDNTELSELIEYFDESSFPVIERREILGGFLVHPIFTQQWKGVGFLIV